MTQVREEAMPRLSENLARQGQHQASKGLRHPDSQPGQPALKERRTLSDLSLSKSNVSLEKLDPSLAFAVFGKVNRTLYPLAGFVVAPEQHQHLTEPLGESIVDGVGRSLGVGSGQRVVVRGDFQRGLSSGLF